MPVPTYDQFIEPILRYLATKPDGASTRDLYDAAAVAFGLTDSDRAEMLPSGIQPVLQQPSGLGAQSPETCGSLPASGAGYGS
jgi:restriction system protein